MGLGVGWPGWSLQKDGGWQGKTPLQQAPEEACVLVLLLLSSGYELSLKGARTGSSVPRLATREVTEPQIGGPEGGALGRDQCRSRELSYFMQEKTITKTLGHLGT